jgi:hypothetical protein
MLPIKGHKTKVTQHHLQEKMGISMLNYPEDTNVYEIYKQHKNSRPLSMELRKQTCWRSRNSFWDFDS